jgi:hypothetical protein
MNSEVGLLAVDVGGGAYALLQAIALVAQTGALRVWT